MKTADTNNSTLFSKLFNNKENFIVFTFFLSALYIWFSVLSNKYYNLGYYDWDLAIYNQIIWTLSQGRMDASLWGMNYLANHSEYILFLLVPFYKIFSHPLTLIFFKVLSFVSGSYILFRVARETFSLPLSLLFSFLFLIYPPNIFALLHEFNVESLNIPFIFLLFYFYRHKKFLAFTITMILLALIKENMPAIIVMFGIWGLLSKDRNKIKWGVMPLVFGILALYLILFVFTPWFRKDFSTSNQYINHFSTLGHSFPEIITTLISKPIKIFQLLYTKENIKYLGDLFQPIIFIPFFKPQILLLGLPIFLQNLLSTSPYMHSIHYHYAATLSPFIFLATVEAFVFFQKILRPIFFGFALIIFTILFFINLNTHQSELKPRITYDPESYTKQNWKLINVIGKDEGIITSFHFLAPLSQRQSVQTFYALVRDTQGLNFDKKFKLLDDIKLALINFDDPWILDVYLTKKAIYLDRFIDFFKDNWKVKLGIENTVLFEKNEEGLKLVEVSREPFPLPSVHIPPVIINNEFVFLASEINPKLTKSREIIPLTFYWKSTKDIHNLYYMNIDISHNGKKIHNVAKTIGYFIHPTNRWKAGEYIKEHLWIFLENAKPGKYSLEINFAHSPDFKFNPMYYVSDSSKLNKLFKLNLGDLQLK